MKIDIVKDEGKVLSWKQVERRDGLTFMRMRRISKKVLFGNVSAQ